MLSRRHFLLACSSTMVAVGAVPGSLLAATSRAGEALDGFKSMPRKRQFAAMVGQTFQVHDEDWNVVDLQLSELKDFSTSEEVEAFSLTFIGPDVPKIASGTYTAWHRRTGEFSLFIHPRDEGATTRSYGADFCLLDFRAVSA